MSIISSPKKSAGGIIGTGDGTAVTGAGAAAIGDGIGAVTGVGTTVTGTVIAGEARGRLDWHHSLRHLESYFRRV
jgi:hypothetical protein